MENETILEKNEKKKISKRKQLSVMLNPLKTAKHSKYLNPQLLDLIRNPDVFASKIMKAIMDLEKEELDVRERILYINTLLNCFKMFGEYYKREDDRPNLLTKEELERTIEVLKEYEGRIEVIRDKQNNPVGTFRIEATEKEETINKEKEGDEDVYV